MNPLGRFSPYSDRSTPSPFSRAPSDNSIDSDVDRVAQAALYRPAVIDEEMMRELGELAGLMEEDRDDLAPLPEQARPSAPVIAVSDSEEESGDVSNDDPMEGTQTSGRRERPSFERKTTPPKKQRVGKLLRDDDS